VCMCMSADTCPLFRTRCSERKSTRDTHTHTHTYARTRTHKHIEKAQAPQTAMLTSHCTPVSHTPPTHMQIEGGSVTNRDDDPSICPRAFRLVVKGTLAVDGRLVEIETDTVPVRCRTHCTTLQHTTSHYNTLQHTKIETDAVPVHCRTHCNTLQRTARHFNTLQHTAK